MFRRFLFLDDQIGIGHYNVFYFGMVPILLASYLFAKYVVIISFLYIPRKLSSPSDIIDTYVKGVNEGGMVTVFNWQDFGLFVLALIIIFFVMLVIWRALYGFINRMIFQKSS